MHITIVSPAKQMEEDVLLHARQHLQQAGFGVTIAPHAACKHHYFAGTDAQRLQDLQQALDAPDTDIILCSRGGYGTLRLIGQLDFSGFKQHPKLIAGFSDITILHHQMQQLGFPSVHAPMPITWQTNTEAALTSLLNVLNGKPNTYTFPTHIHNRQGSVTAPIVGGNLAVLTSLLGHTASAQYQ